MLAIEVTFLTGRYVATAYNRRTEGEWPPHPARLFSAFAAVHFAADATMDPGVAAERAVLEWLERQGAPSIVAPEATSRETVTVFVPVNDVALTDVDDEARQLDEARNALAAARESGDAKTVRQQTAAVTTAQAKLTKAVTRATEVPVRPLNPLLGQVVLPEHRLRQSRSFPSVTPEKPSVTYVWEKATPNDEQRNSLDYLLSRVARLGHSSSLVSVRLLADPGPPTWRPDPDGEETFRTVESGQLAALQRAFDRHHEVEPRVMPAVQESYARHRATAALPAPRSIFSDDWLVLRRVSGPQVPMTSSAGIARAVRRTLMSQAVDPIPELLSGHAPDGTASQQPHLVIAPLPFVGHRHASGAIVGVALILPRTTSAEERRTIFLSVSRWEEVFRQEGEDAPVVRLNLGSAGELGLERIEWGVVQASLRPSVWCAPAKVWHSVTPVALDRNPGDLRSRDTGKLAEAIREAVDIIGRSCQRIGVPKPAYVEILPAPAWAGAAKARHYPPYPDDHSRTRRVLTHVRVEFDEPVAGPIVLGSGRYSGLGLFRPEPYR